MTDEQTIDTSYYDDYQAAAAEPTRLKPGKYFLELPATFPSEMRTDYQGRSGIEFNIGQSKVVADAQGTEVRGYINRYARISTLAKGDQKFSDVADFLAMFGLDVQTQRDTLKTREDFEAAVAAQSGKRTPVPIRLGYQGYYKNPLTQKPVYLKSKDFLLPDGEYARVGYVVDGIFTLTPAFPQEIGVNDYKAQNAHAKVVGWTTVFANFEPEYRAWATKG